MVAFLRIAQQRVLQPFQTANAPPHPIWVRNDLETICDANDIETQFDELHLMVSNLVLNVAHMEAQLAVDRTFAAIQSYIGSAAAVAPMQFAFVHSEGLIAVVMNHGGG